MLRFLPSHLPTLTHTLLSLTRTAHTTPDTVRNAVNAILRSRSSREVESTVAAAKPILDSINSTSTSTSTSTSSPPLPSETEETLTQTQIAKLILKLAKFGVREPIAALHGAYHSHLVSSASPYPSSSSEDMGSGEDAEEIDDRSAKVYDAVLTTMCKQNNMRGVERALAERSEAGVEKTTQTYNTLLYFYGVRKEFDKVGELLETMRAAGLRETLTTYSIRIKGLLSVGLAGEAADVLDEMIAAGLSPNRYVYQTLISYFLKSHAFEKVDALMETMADAGIKPNVVLYTNIIDTYLKANAFDDAKRVYSTMLGERVKPNVATFTSFIQAYLKAGNIGAARLMYQNMLDLGISPTVRTHTAFLVYYTRVGDDDSAKDTLDTILSLRPSQLDRVVYTAIMLPLYKAGDTDATRAVFDSMFENNVFPDDRPYNMILALYLKDGNLDRATDILALMDKNRHPFKLWSLLFTEKSLLGTIPPDTLDAFTRQTLLASRSYTFSNRDMRFLVRQLIHAGKHDQAVAAFVQGPALMGSPYSNTTYRYLAAQLKDAGVSVPSSVVAPTATVTPFVL